MHMYMHTYACFICMFMHIGKPEPVLKRETTDKKKKKAQKIAEHSKPENNRKKHRRKHRTNTEKHSKKT